MDPLEVISSKFLNPAYLNCLFALLKVNCLCSQNGLKKKNKQKMINKIKLNVGKRSRPKAFISLSKSSFKKVTLVLKSFENTYWIYPAFLEKKNIVRILRDYCTIAYDIPPRFAKIPKYWQQMNFHKKVNPDQF